EHPSWTVLQKDSVANGFYMYVIPADAIGRGLTFRASARDRAGNIGFGYSQLVQVRDGSNSAENGAAPAAQQTAATPPVLPAESNSSVVTSSPGDTNPNGAAPPVAFEIVQPDTTAGRPTDVSPITSEAPAGQPAPPPTAAPISPPSPPADLKI